MMCTNQRPMWENGGIIYTLYKVYREQQQSLDFVQIQGLHLKKDGK
jgi:hypothetical protein